MTPQAHPSCRIGFQLALSAVRILVHRCPLGAEGDRLLGRACPSRPQAGQRSLPEVVGRGAGSGTGQGLEQSQRGPECVLFVGTRLPTGVSVSQADSPEGCLFPGDPASWPLAVGTFRWPHGHPAEGCVPSPPCRSVGPCGRRGQHGAGLLSSDGVSKVVCVRSSTLSLAFPPSGGDQVEANRL